MIRKLNSCTSITRTQVLFIITFFFAARLAAQPVIKSLSPAFGPIGSTLTINGNNFKPGITSNTVYFGAAKAIVNSATLNSVVVTVPAQANFQPLSVKTDSLTAFSSEPFNVSFPGAAGPMNSGSFALKASIPVGTDVSGEAIADIDGDGRADLVSWSANIGSVSVSRNTGTPTNISFGAKIDVQTGIYVCTLTVGDLNGDGKPDLIITWHNQDGRGGVYINNSTPGNVSFLPVVQFVSGNDLPESVCIADFDNDGRPDWAVASNDGAAVVFWNLTEGGVFSYDYRGAWGFGTAVHKISASDIDGDGHVDLIVTSNKSAILRNTIIPGGFINFSTPIYVTGDLSFDAAVGDLDGDGKPDLVYVEDGIQGSTYIDFMKNTSTPDTISFGPKIQSDMLPLYLPATVSIADINGDGKPDVIANNRSVISIFRNISSGSSLAFDHYTGFDFGTSISVNSTYDWDGDGTPDILLAGTDPNSISVMENHVLWPVIFSVMPNIAGAGSVITIKGKNFTGVTKVAFGSISAAGFTILSDTVIVATIGSGGQGDISVTSPRGTATYSLYTFTNIPVLSSIIPAAGAAGSIITIAGTNFNTTPSNNLINFGSVQIPAITATKNKLTVAVPNGLNTDPVSLLTGGLFARSDESFTITFPDGGVIDTNSFIKTNFSIENKPFNFVLTDLDGDGKPDITVLEYDSTVIYKNTSENGLFSFTKIATLPIAGSIMSADVDGDGKQDIILGGEGIAIFRNTGSAGHFSFSRFDISTNGNQINQIQLADMDLDGKPDLVLASGGPIILISKCTSGNISFAAPLFLYQCTTVRTLAVADFDGDGLPDIVTACSNENQGFIYRNTSTSGNISFADFLTLVPMGNTPIYISAADFDNDGKIDFAVINSTAGSVSIFKNISTIGNINITGRIDVQTGSYPAYMSVGDLDGDGRTDLAIANSGFNNPSDSLISLIKNTSRNGTMSFANAVNFPTGKISICIATCDLDGDGRYEVLVANQDSKTLTELKYQPNPLAPPKIIGFSPQFAAKGDTVTISGSNFNNITSVSFGGVPASFFIDQTAATVKAVVGEGATGNVDIITTHGQDTLGGFVFITAPHIDSFSPDSGRRNSVINITGSHFWGVTSLSFGGVPAISFTIISDSSIVAIVASGASGNVAVISEYGTGSKSGFIFIGPPKPHITSFSPSAATTGQIVKISGENLSGAESVFFGGTLASSFTNDSDTLLYVVLGAGSSGDIIVNTSNGADTAKGFTFIPPSVTKPFELISFTGNMVDNQVNIQWQTLNEKAVVKYILYVSTDSLFFSAINTVYPLYDSGINTYNYVDTGISGKIKYYQLTVLDSNGQIITEKIISAQNSITAPGEIKLYPNPAHNYITVVHPASFVESKLLLIDMSGRIMQVSYSPPNSTVSTFTLIGSYKGFFKLTWTDGLQNLTQSVFIN